ncbi:hypothetical protein KGF56_000923 [Candida oxycetoniae]|uniref:Conserved oligomeric Golgi complex subunit 2 n=1 Tax=Candida oxycetoniae TaxID=497107 RepID=A0AAI9WZJ7_9ASCO|nr:uncharacterized protein KGF56_000923 [Candida oxycetoniae]KAI3406442.1 hypothetical protein KGF56_000923 [Candida oxycetoniae]
MNEEEIVINSEDFPFQETIRETDFKQDMSEDQIDQFLYKNHRFTSLDILIKDLQELSQQLNQNLLSLVNQDYNDFIKLGKSINGGDELISSISEDLKNFKIDLEEYRNQFQTMDDDVSQVLEKRQLLVDLKTNLKLNLLIHEQMDLFDICVKETNTSVEQLRRITSVYLSIMNTNKYLENDGFITVAERSHFQDQYVHSKISSIFLEFKSFLQQMAENGKRDQNNDLVLEIAKVQTVLSVK